MFQIDWENNPAKPLQHLLDQCQTVVIANARRPHLMKRWAREHCQSFIWMDEVVPIVGDHHDYAVCFYFWDEKDKLMFALKFK